MAISLRGTPVNSTTVTSGNIQLTLPTGTTTGDYVLFWIAYRSNAAFTEPAGGYWSKLQESNTGNTATSGGTASGVLFGGYYNASMGTTFTRTGGDLAQATCISLQGVATTGALEASAIATTNTTSLTVPGGTPTTDFSWVFYFASIGDNGTVSAHAAQNGSPASWTEIRDQGVNTGADGGINIAYGDQTTATAIGNITATSSATGTHVSASCIIKPLVIPRSPARLSLLGVS